MPGEALTTTGRPVLVGIVPDPTGADFDMAEGSGWLTALGNSGTGYGDIAIRRDSTWIAYWTPFTATGQAVAPSLMTLDVPASGTHTYAAYGSSVHVERCRLFAFEL